MAVCRDLLLLLGCWRIARRCFPNAESHWASVSLIAAFLTMPLPGIAILLADQYLHPRTLATALILAAIVAVIDRKPWIAGVLLLSLLDPRDCRLLRNLVLLVASLEPAPAGLRSSIVSFPVAAPGLVL